MSLAGNPVILAMGASYFCIKFLRYALDSWLPAFLNLQGLDVARASYYSQVFDFAGLGGVVLAGWALDRWFRGNWAALCAWMALGVIAGYAAVLRFGSSPVAVAICFGLVGFMLYGPDTVLCGAASVQVAGEKNAVAVAGLVNGLGSIGSVLQEQVIGWLVRGNALQGMRNTNRLALAMSILMACLLAGIAWRWPLLGKARRPGPLS
jgi:sugar phosphate permease